MQSARKPEHDISALRYALDYATNGWAVFPCDPASKKPLTPNGFKDASLDERHIRSWWARYPDAMIGLPTGSNSGVWVLDIDNKPGKDGITSLSDLESKHGALPETLRARTPSGGAHIYFNCDGIKIHNRANIAPGIDVRGDGGYVILPGSVRSDGCFYEWTTRPDDPTDSPTWLLERVTRPRHSEKPSPDTGTSNQPYVDAAINSELAKLIGTAAGRNDQLNLSAFAIGQFVGAGALSYSEAEERLMGAARANGYCNKDGEQAARATIRSGLNAGVTEPRDIPRPKSSRNDYVRPGPAANDNFQLFDVTEDAVAARFAELLGDELSYCHSTGAWFQWDGNIWRKNETSLIFHKARLLARELSDDQLPKVKAAIQKTGFASGVDRFCRADPIFAVTIEAWDQDPFKLGTPAGTVDLRTGVLAPGRREDGITKMTAVAPSAVPTCPRWLRFLDETTGGDAELVRFLQQWCGYSLTGITREHALVFVFGGGGNGKSVFLNTAIGILADYAKTAAMDTFTASHSEKHPTDLAMLRGARLVTASETEEGKAWAEARIKQLTGGDPISARFMRQDFFTFTPQFKLTIIGNHKPVLQNVDEAARRRFNIVPFVRKPACPDRELESKLKLEWPGILRWMIDGCLDWQANGLVRPQSTIDATNTYFSEQDLFGQWIEDECDTDAENVQMWDRSSVLLASWTTYAEAAGEKPGSGKTFAENMRKRGFPPKRTSTARGFGGVRVKDGRANE